MAVQETAAATCVRWRQPPVLSAVVVRSLTQRTQLLWGVARGTPQVGA